MRMTKIRAVTMFVIAQVALAREHTSRRFANTTAADRVIRCNRNTVANSLSNKLSAAQGNQKGRLPLHQQLWTTMVL